MKLKWNIQILYTWACLNKGQPRIAAPHSLPGGYLVLHKDCFEHSGCDTSRVK